MSRRWSSQRNHRFSVAVLLPLAAFSYVAYRLSTSDSAALALPYSYGTDELSTPAPPPDRAADGGGGFAAWARLRPTGTDAATRATEDLLDRLIRVPEDEVGKIAICASLYNEGRFITEWLLYNRAIGVDRFYLYDTGSTDDTLEVLQPWMEAGTVKLHRFNADQGGHFQMNSLETCSRTYASETDWILDTDVDEFYVPTPALSSTTRRRPLSTTDMPDKPLLTLLADNWLYHTADVVAASRVTFKNGGFDRLPNEASVLATQTLRDIYHSILYDKLKFTKSIIHTRHQPGWIIPGAHYVKHMTLNASDSKIITVDGQRIEPEMFNPFAPEGEQGTLYKGQFETRAFEPLLMYHFVERDLDNCLEKLRRVSVVRKGGWRHTAGEEGCRSYEMYQANDQWVPVHEKDSFYGGAVKDVMMSDSWYGQHLPSLIRASLARARRLVNSPSSSSSSSGGNGAPSLPFQPHFVDPHPDMVELWRQSGFDLQWGESPEEREERRKWEVKESARKAGAAAAVKATEGSQQQPPAAAGRVEGDAVASLLAGKEAAGEKPRETLEGMEKRRRRAVLGSSP
ncbi:hypothetical protein JCM6882_004546 [Rhodosporidiobolus microsporus]